MYMNLMEECREKYEDNKEKVLDFMLFISDSYDHTLAVEALRFVGGIVEDYPEDLLARSMLARLCEEMRNSRHDSIRSQVATFTREYDETYFSSKSVAVRLAVALGSTKWHNLLAHDESAEVREAVGEGSNDWHCILKDDKSPSIRQIVATSTDLYHEYLKDDTCPFVRAQIASMSTKYHRQFRNDASFHVLLAVVEASKDHHDYIKGLISEMGMLDPYGFVMKVIDDFDSYGHPASGKNK